MKHTIKEWIVATRPWSFPASTMPVLVTLGWCAWQNLEVNWLIGIWTLVTMALFQAVGNTWSDYFDYKTNVDAKDTYGSTNITSGLFSAEEIRCLSLILSAITILSGIGLVLCTGTLTLILGIIGLLLSIFYPWLKYHALGDVDIFLCYAVLPMLGTTFVATSSLHPEVLTLAVPVGFITIGILHANNARDVNTDLRAGIVTLPILFGHGFSRWAYYIEVLLPFAWTLVCIFAGLLPWWSVLVWVAFLPAFRNSQAMSKLTDNDNSSIIRLDESTAQLQLMFSVLLTFGLLIAAFI